jgi:hypothetical protein
VTSTAVGVDVTLAGGGVVPSVPSVGVGVTVGRGVGPAVGVDVRAAMGSVVPSVTDTSVDVGRGRGVDVAVGGGVGVLVAAGVDVTVGLGIGVPVGRTVGVAVGRGRGVAVGVGTSDTEDPLPASNVIGGGQTQRRHPRRSKAFAGTGHGSALQLDVYGVANQPDHVQPAVTAAYGKGGDIGVSTKACGSVVRASTTTCSEQGRADDRRAHYRHLRGD